jgi:hypothetical protein
MTAVSSPTRSFPLLRPPMEEKLLTGVSTYQAFEVDGNALRMTAIDAQGNVIDELSIRK